MLLMTGTVKEKDGYKSHKLLEYVDKNRTFDFFERLSAVFTEKDLEPTIYDLTIKKGEDEFDFDEIDMRKFIETIFSLSGNMHTLDDYEKLVEKIEGDSELDWTLIDILRQVRNGEVLQSCFKK